MNTSAPSPFDSYKANYSKRKEESMSLVEYLEASKTNDSMYANPHQRMLTAIGKPVAVNFDKEPEMARIHGSSTTLYRYPGFSAFRGLEKQTGEIVDFFKDGARGGESRKQVLYLLGPVGSGKSSLGEQMRRLMEQEPIYVLKAGDKISPIFESPLSLFNPRKKDDVALLEQFNINPAIIKTGLSPWAIKRLGEFDGDISKFSVVKMYPSIDQQIANARLDPGDESTQDLSMMIGKTDMRMLERYSQSDTDAYTYSGGLNRSNQGMLEMPEMFKTLPKLLFPILFATQDYKYKASEQIGDIPYTGVVIAHSNISEWEKFKGNSDNAAFVDRIIKVEIPHMLRTDDERAIYELKLDKEILGQKKVGPNAIDFLSKFAVTTRLKPTNDARILLSTKRKVYNGEKVGDDVQSKPYHEFLEAARLADVTEGMADRTFTLRDGFKMIGKLLSQHEVQDGTPSMSVIDVIEAMTHHIKHRTEKLSPEEEKHWNTDILEPLKKEYVLEAAKEIREAQMERGHGYAQDLFEQYVAYINLLDEGHQVYKHPFSGTPSSREQIVAEAQKIERLAGVSNPTDFRTHVLKFVLRYKANNGGKLPDWKQGDNRLADAMNKIIEASLTSSMAIPIFGAARSGDEKASYDRFVERLEKRGYNERMIGQLQKFLADNKQPAP
ncbi:MAG: PrkA family serine protein kinase [Alphaproteobacteria bacterium]